MLLTMQKNGYLCNDTADFVHVLRTILHDGIDYRIIEQAQKDIEEKYSLQNAKQHFIEYYEDSIDKKI